MRVAFMAVALCLLVATPVSAKINRNPDPKDHYAIIVDAGSSGSRLQIYGWDSIPTKSSSTSAALDAPTFPKIDELVNKKIQPGLSTFSKTPRENLKAELQQYWKFLLDLAQGYVPKGTTFYLFATAGMRLLPEAERRPILYTSCDVIKGTGHFDIGSCEDHIRVIGGLSEAVYGWLSVNYLQNSFQPFHRTFGMLDMGGASQQIAFETHAGDPDAVKVCLQLGGGQNRIGVYHVYVKTFLGFGMQETRAKYLDKLQQDADMTERIERASQAGPKPSEAVTGGSQDALQVDTVTVTRVSDPCLPEGLEIAQEVEDDSASKDGKYYSSTLVTGTGDFEKCYKLILPLLKGVTFPTAPKLNFQDHIPFVGVSEYWYSSHDIFNLGGGKYTPSKFYAMGQALCGSPWALHEQMLNRNLYPRRKGIDLDRARYQCFKAAWMLAVLHDGFRLPWKGRDTGETKEGAERFRQMLRIIYEDADEDVEGRAQGESCPQDRVLGICPVPTVKHFQSALELDGREVSWALGAALMIVMAEGHNPFQSTCPFTDDEIAMAQPSYATRFVELVTYRMKHVKGLRVLAAGIAVLVGYWLYQKVGNLKRGKGEPLKMKEKDN